MIPGKEKKILSAFVCMIVTEALIFLYIFFVVPTGADINLGGFLFGGQPFPQELYYLLPIILLQGGIIIIGGNSKAVTWLVGLFILYLAIGIYIDTAKVIANGFMLNVGTFGGVYLLTIPFWCAFFFLWELLFCGIAKWWRKRRENPEADEPHK